MYSPIYNSKYIPLFIMRTYAHIPTRAPIRARSPPRAQENTPHPKRPEISKPEKPKPEKCRNFQSSKKPEKLKPQKTPQNSIFKKAHI